MDGVWLSPIFTSPQKDGGYDIANYTEVDPIFGSLTDFDQLVQTCKDNGIHLILDFVPNVTKTFAPPVTVLDFLKISLFVAHFRREYLVPEVCTTRSVLRKFLCVAARYNKSSWRTTSTTK